MLCTFYGGYCSLWPNRTVRSLSRAWPSLLRAHNHIGGATAVPLHHKKCLLCSVLIYIVLGHSTGSSGSSSSRSASPRQRRPAPTQRHARRHSSESSSPRRRASSRDSSHSPRPIETPPRTPSLASLPSQLPRDETPSTTLHPRRIGGPGEETSPPGRKRRYGGSPSRAHREQFGRLQSEASQETQGPNKVSQF